jgi:hypothetical protein
MRYVAFILIASLAVAADAPKLQFDKTIFHFGQATEGDERAGKFTFRNAGNAELKIGVPETSCGCTAVTVKPDTLRPGERGEINFTLDLTNIRGEVKKTISVPSNDPDQPVVNLSIIGDAKPLFEIEPPMVYLGEVTPGETARATIHVRRLDGKKLSVAKAEGAREYLTTAVEAATETESKLMIEVKGTGRPEQFSDIVEVTLAGGAKPAFHIPVAGMFVASVKVEPAMLVWKVPDREHWPGPDEEAATVRKLIVSATVTNRPLTVGEFASTSPDLLVKIAEVKTGQVYEVTLKLAGPPAESSKEWLTFETNTADHPTVAVPIRIIVTKPD